MVKTRKRKSSEANVTEEPQAKVEATEQEAKAETGAKEDPPAAEAKEETLSPAEQKLKNFIKYYKEIGLVPETEWKAFMKANLCPTPMSFRFLESHRLCESNIDTTPGIPSQAKVLCEYMKKKHVESLNKLTVEGKNVQLAPLKWYPNELGWALNIPLMNMEKYLGLKEFDGFLNTEKNLNTLQKLETWSMFPPTLIDVRPHHKVLDMCASPGFIAGQLSEVMHADPGQSDQGLLVLNDLFKHNDRMQYRWTQGAKVLFTCNDARTYPEIYEDNKHSPENQLRYDRVICDVRCSNDGTMRKNVGIQEQWASKAAMAYHTEQRAILRRALELVEKKGVVLYCTTSYNPVENEAVIMSLLKEAEGTVELVDSRRKVKGGFKFRPGMTTWKIMTEDGSFLNSYAESTEEFQKQYPESIFPPPIKEANAFHMERCIRVLPHDNDSAGFFCAVLVRNNELPWVKAKRLEDARKKMAGEIDGSDELKKYGYRIRLKCNVALSSILWSTETTDEKLNTTTVEDLESFVEPELEIDPNCKPQKLVSQYGVEEPFAFCEPDTPQWTRLKKFFNISDDFDPTYMVMREGKTDFYLTSPMVKTVVTHNKDRPDITLSLSIGVRMFHQLNRIWIPFNTPCNALMTNQGFAHLYPYIEKQVVQVNKEDMMSLAHNERVKIDTLSEKAQEDIKETDQGCILLIYKPENLEEFPNCNIAFVGVRGENYITDFRDGKPGTEKTTTYRLCGFEHEDYKRKLQEEKLAKALALEKEKEKEKEEKAKAEENKADGEEAETMES